MNAYQDEMTVIQDSLLYSTGRGVKKYDFGASVQTGKTYYAAYRRSFNAKFYLGVNKEKTHTISSTLYYKRLNIF